MLRTITSPVLNEFVIRGTYGSVLRKPRTTTGWDAVDALLSVMAERNPDFRVVFRVVPPQPPGDAQPTYGDVRSLATHHLPLISYLRRSSVAYYELLTRCFVKGFGEVRARIWCGEPELGAGLSIS